MAADGSAEVRLTDDSGTDGTPAWSPDGRTIVFVSDRTGSDQIWLMNADGSGQTQLTHGEGANQVPAYSPDGTRIAFVSDRSGSVEVWSMAADGTDLRNLTRSPSRANGQWSVGWSPDGRSIIYASSALPSAENLPIVRVDLGAAGALLEALVLASVALLLVGLGPPLGTFAFVLGLTVALAAFVSDEWRFVPAAILGGLAIDLLLARVDSRHRPFVAAAGLPAALVLGLGATLIVTGSLGWTPTLWLGVAAASAGIGLGLASLTRWSARRSA
jgi:hypothetical protein